MKNILEYKGYLTKVEYSVEDQVLYGKIEGIKDLINFECEKASEVESAFHQAVDDYLAFCEDVGKESDRIYSGTFNVRISPELHKQISMMAFRNNESLNQTVENAINKHVNGISQTETKLTETIVTLSGVLFSQNMKMHQVPKITPEYNFDSVQSNFNSRGYVQ